MHVELIYDGLKLGPAVSREESGGLFVELADPLPVGTTLTLIDGQGPRLLEVARVVESQPAGMWLKEEAHPNPAAELPPPSPTASGRKGRRRSKTFTGR